MWFYGPPDSGSIQDFFTGHSSKKWYAWSPDDGVILVAKDENNRIPSHVKDGSQQADADAYGIGWIVPVPEFIPAPVPV